MSMCGKVSHAIAAEQAGCDVVIAQGTEAGGHTGKVAGMALIPQIVDAVEIPVVAAGSIVDGRGLAVALAFGAQGVWMGTRFIASEEAHAAPLYKTRLTEAGSADTVVTRCYSGKPMRVVGNSYVDDWERRTDEIKPFPDQMSHSVRTGVLPLMSGSDEDIDLERSCLPAGQGIGGINEILPVREIMDRVMRDARETIERLGGLL
jgi:enoyl-[acyl-carrier protein] reductase II